MLPIGLQQYTRFLPKTAMKTSTSMSTTQKTGNGIAAHGVNVCKLRNRLLHKDHTSGCTHPSWAMPPLGGKSTATMKLKMSHITPTSQHDWQPTTPTKTVCVIHTGTHITGLVALPQDTCTHSLSSLTHLSYFFYPYIRSMARDTKSFLMRLFSCISYLTLTLTKALSYTSSWLYSLVPGHPSPSSEP